MRLDPGEALRSAAACRRLSDSGCADLRRGRRRAAASCSLRGRLRREMKIDSNAQEFTLVQLSG